VPTYLLQRKMELAAQQAAQQEAKEQAWIPAGGSLGLGLGAGVALQLQLLATGRGRGRGSHAATGSRLVSCRRAHSHLFAHPLTAGLAAVLACAPPQACAFLATRSGRRR
jgi:hypothetical protein